MSGPFTVRYWVEQLHADYLARGKREATWRDEYWKIYKRLPLDAVLTKEMLHALVLETPVNSRTRVRCCMAIKVLARFAEIPYDPSPYRGSYNPNAVNPRNLPSDEVIVQWYARIKNPAWRWVYGMVATYALRTHEAFRLELEHLHRGDRVIHVGDNSKTGFHRVWAYHPEWFDDFDLGSANVPNIKLDRENRRLGEAAAEYFHETARLPFTLMDLRHAWAGRVILYGLADSLAAQQMGHSLEVHNRIYQKWVGRKIHQDAYDATLKNPHRPRPPKFPK